MSTDLSTKRSWSVYPAVAALIALCGLPLGCGGTAEVVDEWPQWRGAERNGITPATPLPVHWAEDAANVRWKTEIPGVGNSSPVVKNGRVFLTYAHRRDRSDAAEKGDRPAKEAPWRSAMAFDLESGAVAWKNDLFQTPQETIHRVNTMAAPTPVAGDNGVYVYFGSVVYKLAQDTGEVLWRQSVDETYSEVSHYGAASSPVLSKDSVIVLRDGEKAGNTDVGWLTALDRETGEVRWRIDLPGYCCTYTSPLVVDRGAGEEVWVAHSGALISNDAETGELLWKTEYVINQMVATPVISGDLVLISGGAHNVKNNLAIELTGAGKETEVARLWTDKRFAPQNASPVLLDGLYYTVTDQGILTSRDPRTGDVHYNERVGQGRNRASLVAGEGKIYVQSTSGNIVVVEGGTEYKQLARNYLGEPGSNASPAIAGGCLLLRTRVHLHCVDGSVPYDPPPVEEETAASI